MPKYAVTKAMKPFYTDQRVVSRPLAGMVPELMSSGCQVSFKKLLVAVGFEPTTPKRLVPEISALDRSATLPHTLLVNKGRLIPTNTSYLHYVDMGVNDTYNCIFMIFTL